MSKFERLNALSVTTFEGAQVLASSLWKDGGAVVFLVRFVQVSFAATLSLLIVSTGAWAENCVARKRLRCPRSRIASPKTLLLD